MLSPRPRAGSSSPARFDEGDTLYGIFLGPSVNPGLEDTIDQRVQRRLANTEHESRAQLLDVERPLPRSDASPGASNEILEWEAESLSYPDEDHISPSPSPSRLLRPRKRVTLSPVKTRRRSHAAAAMSSSRISLPASSTLWLTSEPSSSSKPYEESGPGSASTSTTPYPFTFTSTLTPSASPSPRRRTRASIAAEAATVRHTPPALQIGEAIDEEEVAPDVQRDVEETENHVEHAITPDPSAEDIEDEIDATHAPTIKLTSTLPQSLETTQIMGTPRIVHDPANPFDIRQVLSPTPRYASPLFADTDIRSPSPRRNPRRSTANYSPEPPTVIVQRTPRPRVSERAVFPMASANPSPEMATPKRRRSSNAIDIPGFDIVGVVRPSEQNARFPSGDVGEPNEGADIEERPESEHEPASDNELLVDVPGNAEEIEVAELVDENAPIEEDAEVVDAGDDAEDQQPCDPSTLHEDGEEDNAMHTLQERQVDPILNCDVEEHPEDQIPSPIAVKATASPPLTPLKPTQPSLSLTPGLLSLQAYGDASEDYSMTNDVDDASDPAPETMEPVYSMEPEVVSKPDVEVVESRQPSPPMASSMRNASSTEPILEVPEIPTSQVQRPLPRSPSPPQQSSPSKLGHRHLIFTNSPLKSPSKFAAPSTPSQGQKRTLRHNPFLTSTPVRQTATPGRVPGSSFGPPVLVSVRKVAPNPGPTVPSSGAFKARAGSKSPAKPFLSLSGRGSPAKPPTTSVASTVPSTPRELGGSVLVPASSRKRDREAEEAGAESDTPRKKLATTSPEAHVAPIGASTPQSSARKRLLSALEEDDDDDDEFERFDLTKFKSPVVSSPNKRPRLGPIPSLLSMDDDDTTTGVDGLLQRIRTQNTTTTAPSTSHVVQSGAASTVEAPPSGTPQLRIPPATHIRGTIASSSKAPTPQAVPSGVTQSPVKHAQVPLIDLKRVHPINTSKSRQPGQARGRQYRAAPRLATSSPVPPRPTAAPASTSTAPAAPASVRPRSTVTSTITNAGARQAAARSFPMMGSPVKPTSRPVPLPSPARPAAPTAAHVSMKVSSPSKVSTLNSSVGSSSSSSPARRPVGASDNLSGLANRPKGVGSNENIFQPRSTLPPTVVRVAAPRSASSSLAAQTKRPAPAAKTTQPASVPAQKKTVTPRVSSLPVPRGASGVASTRPLSRLPRPSVSLAKTASNSAPIPFLFGANESTAFAPMNINVSMAQASSSDSTGVNDKTGSEVVKDSPNRKQHTASHSRGDSLGESSDPPTQLGTPPSQNTRSHSPAPSDFSSPDPLAMSPIRPRPRRGAVSSGPTKLSTVAAAEALPPKPKKRKATPSEKIHISALSAAALGKLTNSNTKHNEARVADLELQFILLDIPRPPSPSSKIRTIQQKETAEAELARQRRARNRSIMRGEIAPGEDLDASEPSSSTNRPLKHPRAPGDDEEYHTPKRIRKAMEEQAEEGSLPLTAEAEDLDRQRRKGKGKANKGSGSEGSGSATPPPKRAKHVRWDKLLTMEEPDEGPETRESDDRLVKSALAEKAMTPMMTL
ncbi:hypothetical protein DL93DRAFT_695356 [Clavulina sp. PMI_390]|nr:hypothetical protein DL93DRAFT_695356 [Clavulina sp. PMI_390]